MYIEAHFLGGEPIRDACAEACALAARLRCDVHFRFNDVTCMAFPHSYPEDLEAAWWEATESKSQHKIAAGHPRATDNG